MSLPVEKRCATCQVQKPAAAFAVRCGGKYLCHACRSCESKRSTAVVRKWRQEKKRRLALLAQGSAPPQRRLCASPSCSCSGIAVSRIARIDLRGWGLGHLNRELMASGLARRALLSVNGTIVIRFSRQDPGRIFRTIATAKSWASQHRVRLVRLEP